jgi:hypothetical protein
LRNLSEQLHLREPDITIQVPRSVTGHPFRINEATFWPGSHTVKKSVAQVLLAMIDEQRRVEAGRLQQNGNEIDLGTIGQKAVETGRGI